MYTFKLSLLVLLFVTMALGNSYAQSGIFDEEVRQISERSFSVDPQKPTAVFTGSSSIRMWNNLSDYFPDMNAINTGFGGSQFTDLILYTEELIFDFNPDVLLIYEGDNDINAGKSPAEVLASAAYLYAQIRQELPEIPVYILSAKPSPSRWHYEEEYNKLNELLKEFTAFDEQLYFIDLWNPMLDSEGKPMADIFLDDQLHMNAKGYEIWGLVIQDQLVLPHD